MITFKVEAHIDLDANEVAVTWRASVEAIDDDGTSLDYSEQHFRIDRKDDAEEWAAEELKRMRPRVLDALRRK